MFAPKASKTSAAPDLLETPLLPCFATLHPAAAATNADVVEILNVFALSPPVPTISIHPCHVIILFHYHAYLLLNLIFLQLFRPSF